MLTLRRSKEKKQGTYFKICLTYFKIQGTYFSPSENPFQKRSENADKNSLSVEHKKESTATKVLQYFFQML